MPGWPFTTWEISHDHVCRNQTSRSRISALIDAAPSRDAFYALADGSGKHLDLIEVGSIPDFHADASALKYALEKVAYTVAMPAANVASIRSDRTTRSMMAAMQPGQVR